MKTLVVVDLQKDFYHPEGSLYVSGAEVLPDRVAAIIPQFDAVVFTLDWHPYDHCSFKPQGGIWPVHCVANSEGASLPLNVIGAATGHRMISFRKGRNRDMEEYAAFNTLPADIAEIFDGSDSITLCGLCGDYCVGDTIKNLIKYGYGDKLVVDLDCTGSIDGGTVLNGIIEDNKLKTTK